MEVERDEGIKSERQPLKVGGGGSTDSSQPSPTQLETTCYFFLLLLFLFNSRAPKVALSGKVRKLPEGRQISLSLPLLTRRRKSLKIPERAQHLKNRAFEGSIEQSLCSRQLPFLPSFFLFRSKKRGSSTWKNRKIVEKKKGIRISKFPTFERNNNNNNNSFRFVSL